MQIKNRNAFTMIELIYVIVIIGVLSAIALPKFTETAVVANDARARSEITTVMSAVATERQRRILKGDFTHPITSLGTGGYAFSTFNADADSNTNDVVAFYIDNCGTGDTGCWSRSGTSYIYTFVDSGSASFKLANNKLVCDNDATDCNRLLK